VDLMRAFFAGVLTVIVLVAVAALAAVWFGYVPAAADDPPASAVERWAAHRALDATIAREMPQPPYPYASSDETIVAGAKLYMTNCAVCHGSGGSPQSNVAKGLYVKAPQFTKHGVDDDPEGETYWKIEHGIRFTGMPSFKGSLTEEQIWQIADFLKRPTGALPSAASIIWNGTHGD
jgi:mono/diheme cytochrome c family protein